MTYLVLDLVMLAGVAVLAAAGARAARRRGVPFAAPVAVTLGVLLTLTVVFDSLMIAADLFRYDPAQLVGLRVWLTPVEDLAWPVAAALALPSVWVLLTPVPVRDEVAA
ncbi:lycopene cyclase domain-containing protein [Cellulomonas sp.]|uniref:lycopene cyclase domain-containing protein n=1 Tax=Cellulomonas sp. TaxID=40001 RepID=UPI001B07A35A|nr:lycopene cyclase domain-containing protein [Cellulomonas sp.]MBO9555664.1 lycopene cyclase domain-containing protein [Cellulomonas sp.]